MQVSRYRVDYSCEIGTHLVQYTPNVRGTYIINVEIPIVHVVQRITTHVSSEATLSGNFAFTLNNGTQSLFTTSNVDFDASALDMKRSIESIDGTLSVDVSVVLCKNPHFTCSWDVTFINSDSDSSSLVPLFPNLLGELSYVTITKIVQKRKAQSIYGFPQTVTVKPDKTDPSWTTAHSKGLSIAVAGKETSFTIQPKDRFGNNELENQDSDVFAVFVTSTHGNINKKFSGVIGQVSSNIDGSYNVRYTPTVSGKHTVAVVQATVVETQIITTSFNTLKRGGIFPLNFDEYDFVSIPWDINESTLEELILHRINGISNIDVSKQKIDHYNFRFIISFESVVGDLPIFKVNTTGLTGNVSPWNVKKTNGKFKYIMTVSPDEEIRAPLYGNSKLI